MTFTIDDGDHSILHMGVSDGLSSITCNGVPPWMTTDGQAFTSLISPAVGVPAGELIFQMDGNMLGGDSVTVTADDNSVINSDSGATICPGDYPAPLP